MRATNYLICFVLLLLSTLPVAGFGKTVSGPLARAIKLFEQGQFQTAQGDLKGILARDPNNAAAAYYFGRIALHEGDADSAMQHLFRAANLNADNAQYHYWLGRAYGELAKHANLFKRPYYAVKTKDEFKLALAKDPRNVFARVALVMYTLKAPGFLGGSRQEAEQNAAIVAKQNAVAGYRAYGLIDEQDENYAHAEMLYKKAVSAAPMSSRPYRWLAGVYRLQGQYDKAFKVYQQRIQSHSDWFAHYAFAATALEAGQRLLQAEQLLRAYIRHGSAPEEPSLAEAHHLLGELLTHLGKRQEAQREFELAMNSSADRSYARSPLQTTQIP